LGAVTTSASPFDTSATYHTTFARFTIDIPLTTLGSTSVSAAVKTFGVHHRHFRPSPRPRSFEPTRHRCQVEPVVRDAVTTPSEET